MARRAKPRLDRVLAEPEQRISLASLVEIIEKELPEVLKTLTAAAKGGAISTQSVTAATAILNLVMKHLSEKADSKGMDIIHAINEHRRLTLQKTLEENHASEDAED